MLFGILWALTVAAVLFVTVVLIQAYIVTPYIDKQYKETEDDSEVLE